MSQHENIATRIPESIDAGQAMSFIDELDDNVELSTPIGTFLGRDGVQRFYDILEEYLPNATVHIESMERNGDEIRFFWRAESATASVRRGEFITHLLDSKVEELKIRCEIYPEVMNQG